MIYLVVKIKTSFIFKKCPRTVLYFALSKGTINAVDKLKAYAEMTKRQG